MNVDQGATLFESREKRDEFVPSPHSGVSRGEPKAKLLGTFSLVRFFGVSKEMNSFLYKEGVRLIIYFLCGKLNKSRECI
jgi:hypothetical protein